MSEQKCSRASCTADATVLLDWRNPKIHGADRVKTWSACDAHRDYLSDYLAVRDFLLGVRALEGKP